MVTHITPHGGEVALAEAHRAPLLRRPRPGQLALAAVWVLGLVVGLGLPALVVPPDQLHPETAEALKAFGLTVIGAGILFGVDSYRWWRSKEPTACLVGWMPAVTCVMGGCIMLGTKLA